MPPTVDVAFHDRPAIDEPSRGKRILRYVLHIIHFFIAICLFWIILLQVCYYQPISSLVILYLVPFVILVLIVETCYLCRCKPPRSLQLSLLAPRRLIRRSFCYQLAVCFAFGWMVNGSDRRDEPLFIGLTILLSAIVWMLACMLFALALLAREYDFIDWIEEPKPETDELIRLHGEPEQEVDPEDISRYKRLVQYLLHLTHVAIALLLLDSLWVNLWSTAINPFGLYLLPFIFIQIIVEVYYLCGRNPPKGLVKSFLAPPGLARRAFLYQLAGAYAMAWSGYQVYSHTSVQHAFHLALTVWILGLVLLAIAIASEEYGFEEWVNNPQIKRSIGLDDEESVHNFSRTSDELV